VIPSLDFRPPDWAPLQRALATEFGAEAAGATRAFWFVGFASGPADVGELRVYEHSVTRRMLALDPHGGAYRWVASLDVFSRVSREDALVEALA
jgi:hypothetical protein